MSQSHPKQSTPAGVGNAGPPGQDNDESPKKEIVLRGKDEGEIAYHYQAAIHSGYRITGAEINGRPCPITDRIKTAKAKEWQDYLHRRETGNWDDFDPYENPLDPFKGLFLSPTEVEWQREYFEEINRMIGLEDVKTQVQDIAKVMYNRQQRANAGLPVVNIPQHMVFTGNPGTGKTTVARLIGEMFRKMGVLAKGHLVEVGGRGLIAEYIGQTAPKVRATVTSALDGVLFIDEAYTLAPKDARRDFGAEAVAALIKMMEDYRNRLVVIVAGYKDEMQGLINSNPGLKSRFKNLIDFPDYSPEELAKIFTLLCKEHKYALTQEAIESVDLLFTEMHKAKGAHFGNGRSVRNAFERCVTRQSSRLLQIKNPSNKTLQTIKKPDIPPLSEVQW